MAAYRIFFRPSADRQLQRLPRDAQRRIVREVAALAHDPRPPGVGNLSGAHDLWRIRIGDYRVVYEIEDDRLVVLVLRVAHRRDLYRGQ